MPLALLVFGLLFLVATVRGPEETSKLLALIKSDFTGPGNFFIWILAIGGIAAVGYAKPLRTFSNLFLALIFIMLILLKRGPNGQDLFSSFLTQIRATEGTPAK